MKTVCPTYTCEVDFGHSMLDVGVDYTFSPGRWWSDTGFEGDEVEIDRLYIRPLGGGAWLRCNTDWHNAIIDALPDLPEWCINHARADGYNGQDGTAASLRTMQPLMNDLLGIKEVAK